MTQKNRHNDSNYRRAAYIDGNTVRYAMPDDWEAEQERRRQREEQEQQIRREQRRRRAIARRNQDRALIMNRSYVAFLTLAAILTCITAGFYIKLQSDITIHLENIAALETSVNNLKADNSSTEKRLSTALKMGDVKKQAKKLGMSFPSEDQIVYYEIDNADFMSQYGEIN
jgi:regulator of protease activity HflC (stomatin/prohibitin superfamily)